MPPLHLEFIFPDPASRASRERKQALRLFFLCVFLFLSLSFSCFISLSSPPTFFSRRSFVFFPPRSPVTDFSSLFFYSGYLLVLLLNFFFFKKHEQFGQLVPASLLKKWCATAFCVCVFSIEKKKKKKSHGAARRKILKYMFSTFFLKLHFVLI